MATTSLWHIKGRIDQLINYVENPEKIEDKDLQQLAHIINYAENPVKTEQGLKRYVTGIHCIPELATQEFILTKKQWNKLGGRIAFHGYMSFMPGETDPVTAHALGVKLAKEMWGDKYQVVVTTHLDKGHLHCHFAINSVSFVDGKKYDRTNYEYTRMQKISDRICREYGLSVVEKPKDFKTPRMIYEAEKRGELTPYTILRQDIDYAVKQCKTLYDFNEVMSYMGYRYRYGKYLSLIFEGEQKPIRTYRLGEEYSLDRIKERISQNRKPIVFMWINPPRQKYYPISLDIPNFHYDPVYASLVAVFYLVLAILTALLMPEHSREDNVRKHYISPTLRAEMRKLDEYSKMARLLSANNLKTTDDLHRYREQMNEKLDTLLAYRVEHNKLLKANPSTNELLAKRIRITKAIKIVRDEIKLCDKIEERFVVLSQKLELQKVYEARQVQNRVPKSRDYER